jgi:hypothetical protein
MALLLAGQKVQRASWVRPEKNTHLTLLITDSGDRHVIAQGVEIVFSREIQFTNDVHMSGRDMAADDWQVADATSPTGTEPHPAEGGEVGRESLKKGSEE